MMMTTYDRRQTVAHTYVPTHTHIIDDRFKLIASLSFSLSMNLIKKIKNTTTCTNHRVENSQFKQ